MYSQDIFHIQNIKHNFNHNQGRNILIFKNTKS